MLNETYNILLAFGSQLEYKLKHNYGHGNIKEQTKTILEGRVKD